MITMPMMIKFHNVSERFSRGPELAVVSSLKPLSFQRRNYSSQSPHQPFRMANSQAADAARHTPAGPYSIVSMLTVCAILLLRATAKPFRLARISVVVVLPHFVLHFRTGR